MTPAKAKRLVNELLNAYLRYIASGSVEACNEYLELRMRICEGLMLNRL